MLIYKATNVFNGKSYVGQTTCRLEVRKKDHIKKALNGSTLYFHNALRKYGKDNFKWSIVYRTDKLNNLNRMEQYMIIYYQTTNKEYGYNLQNGGLNKKHTEETKKRISNSLMGRKKTNEHRANMCGHSVSQETKDKIGKANEGRKVSKEIKQKTRERMISLWQNEEYRSKVLGARAEHYKRIGFR